MTKRSTQVKHQQIFTLYNDYLKEFKEQVPSIWRAALDKSMIYTLIGEQTGYSVDYIGRIINTFLKVGSNE